MKKNINIVAALQIGLSIFNLLIAFIIFSALKLVGGFIDNPSGSTILSLIANIIAIIFIIISLPGIFAGIGLYKRKEWARVLTIILSVIELFNFPLVLPLGYFQFGC